MEKQIINVPEKKFIGLKIRTSYRNELDPKTSRIAQIVNQFRIQNVDKRIPNRKQPGTLMIVYTNYASDEYDEYDYLIGEEVNSLDRVPDDMTGLLIPESKYLKITSDPGSIPKIVFDTWEKIWNMTQNKTLGAERKYQVDMEIYDDRAATVDHAIFEVYLGIK